MKIKTIKNITIAVTLFLSILSFGACDLGDSIEGGCVIDEDCYVPGAPEKWCQTETGICLSFTSPPGDTGDATPDE